MNRSTRASGDSRGFTILELMVATAIFALVLLVATAAVTRIIAMYYKGAIISQTQAAARTVTDEISRSIQFGKDYRPGSTQVLSGLTVTSFCVGDRRYSYGLNAKVTDSVGDNVYNTNKEAPHALWRDTYTGAGCPPLNVTLRNPGGTNGRELLDEYMRLTRLAVTQVSGTSIYSIDVGVIYGDSDLVEFSNMAAKTGPLGCLGGVTGAQWCASASLNAQVVRRLGN